MGTLPIIEPIDLPPALSHELDQFRDGEARRYYVEQRRNTCAFMEVMDLWLIVPVCFNCAVEESLSGIVHPYVNGKNWQTEIPYRAGLEVLQRTKRTIRHDPEFAYICKKCGVRLMPWMGDEISVKRLRVGSDEHWQAIFGAYSLAANTSARIKERLRCGGAR